MSNAVIIVLAFFAGLGTGVFFFGGLWLTVRYLLQLPRGHLWFALSYFLRLATAGLALFWIADRDALRAISAASGFFVASILARWLGMHRREVNRAPES